MTQFPIINKWNVNNAISGYFLCVSLGIYHPWENDTTLEPFASIIKQKCIVKNKKTPFNFTETKSQCCHSLMSVWGNITHVPAIKYESMNQIFINGIMSWIFSKKHHYHCKCITFLYSCNQLKQCNYFITRDHTSCHFHK